MVRKTPVAVVASERLLKQYYKRDACRLWSFHSRDLYDKGFYPINPLRVAEHPAVTHKDMLLELKSFVLQKFVQRTFLPEEFQAMVAKTKACAFAVLKMKIENNSSSNTFAQLCTQSNASGKWKFVLNLLLAMEKEGASFFKDDKAAMIKKKKDIIQLGQFGFFGFLDRQNMKQIDLVEKEVL